MILRSLRFPPLLRFKIGTVAPAIIPWMTKTMRVASALTGALLLAGAGSSSAPKPVPSVKTSFNRYPKELARVTFTVAGDVIPHKPVKDAAAASRAPLPAGLDGKIPPGSANHDGWDSLFAGVGDVFRGGDFGFVNLETPVAPSSRRGTKPLQFNAPPGLADALLAAGVNVVSFANNHVMDQGPEGFAETQRLLAEKKLRFAGAGASRDAAWAPLIVEKDGIKVGLVAMTRWLNGYRNPAKQDQPHVAFIPYDDDPTGAPGESEEFALQKIAAAKARCDLLLVSVHWGVEYATAPRDEDVAFAHALLEAGADLILGAHPHVLQPVETYAAKDERTGFIFYSLGNFISNQARNYTHGMTPEKTGEMRDSLVGRFSVVKRDFGAAGTRVELADLGLMPAWTENNLPRVLGGAKEPPSIHPVLVDRELPKAEARVADLQAKREALTRDEKKELTRWLKRAELLRRRRELILGRTGDEYLVPPPRESESTAP